MNPIAEYIEERDVDGMRIFTAPTGAKDVVTIQGSVLGGWNMLPHAKGQVPAFAAELFDAGTRSHTKNELRESLAARGMSVSFSAGGDRTYFSGSCLPEDLNALLGVITECLGEATFPAKELANTRTVTLGELEEEKTETRTQAASALTRLLFSPEHVNYADATATRITQSKAVTRDDLVAFGKKLGRGGLVLAIVGDIESSKAQTAAAKTFKKLGEGTSEPSVKKLNAKAAKAEGTTISINDKANIDVFLGAPVAITRDHELFLAFATLNEMLGGSGFTSHLMQTIRERDGLTYGVYAMPGGFTDGADGAFRIWATFSPNRYEESVAKLRKEIALFFKKEMTEKRLSDLVIELTGKYLVGLSTTSGLAATLHKIGIEGKPLSYIDEYPMLLNALTLNDLQKAADLIPLSKLSLAAAGTFS